MGLGHEFLRHCQRSRLLVHIIDGTSPDPLGDFTAIRTELQLFNPELLNKPQVPPPALNNSLEQPLSLSECVALLVPCTGPHCASAGMWSTAVVIASS